MGWPGMADLPGTETKTAANDGSAGPLLRKSEDADSTRFKNGMHPCHEYDFLASEATEEVRANAGDTGSEASHGATEEQERTEAEEERDETLQRAIPA